MLAESTLFFSQLHKEIYFLRGLFLRSDMATLTFNFESSIFYMQLFNFFLQVFFYFFWQVFFNLLFNFKKCLDLIYNCLIRIHQVFHWLKNNKKTMPNEVKKNWLVYHFLECDWDAVILRCYHRRGKFPLLYFLRKK